MTGLGGNVVWTLMYLHRPHFCLGTWESLVLSTAPFRHPLKKMVTSYNTSYPKQHGRQVQMYCNPLLFRCQFKAGPPPPLDLSFWSFLTFLYHGIEKVERHLLWKFYKKIRRKSWSNVPPKLPACIGFLYKVVHKIGRLQKFNRSREIEFNFFTAWTIPMKFGTLVQHTPGYKMLPQNF